MTISRSVHALSVRLRSHAQAVAPEDHELLGFIDEIASMPSWCAERRLDLWEERVQGHGIDWDLRWSSRDEIFLLAVEFFELGRPSPKQPPSSLIQPLSTLTTVPKPTVWSLLEPPCAIASFTLYTSSKVDAIASSAHGRRLVLSETSTNSENIHDPVS